MLAPIMPWSDRCGRLLQSIPLSVVSTDKAYIACIVVTDSRAVQSTSAADQPKVSLQDKTDRGSVQLPMHCVLQDRGEVGPCKVCCSKLEHVLHSLPAER